MNIKDFILNQEMLGSFKYFWKEANIDKNSKGYGLIRDRAPSNPNVASIAAVGFGLTAIPIGIKRGWISFEEGYERVNGTLDTLLNLDRVNGFFYHFMDIYTGERVWKCEVSIIDTAIAICGAILAGEFFGGEIKKKANKLYEEIDWNWYLDKYKNWFYMGYTPEKGFEGYWDFYAEQLMLYFLAVASPTHPVDREVYYSFFRNYAEYKGYRFINSWLGSIFTYQFSHAWFDFRGKVDRKGIDWFENSILATLANRQFCIDNKDKFKGFNENSWGLTACDGPKGYEGRYGALPSGLFNNENIVDGTVPPCGAAGSIVFTPKESMDALEYYYKNIKGIFGEYGFKDAFNLENDYWVSEDYVGIDKGITLIMIENYITGFVWNTFMKNDHVKKAFELLEFRPVKDENLAMCL
ncbi:glucoamylase family protein [Caloramator australicus]|uniref:Glycoamylase-like domain-containing protein n=1 Tax=Caloramator australicus RC3 TaxID=857293 RepID=G0V3X2_9CLOT|nr:glucoamylase family protein [Caloramator australicus]CCC57812.1 conserved hypothetical protein [Caloramator australicus RC3]